MIEEVRPRERAVADSTDGFVDFLGAGMPASGAFRCASCGYGVAVSTVLPRCPMCAGTSWERELRQSFARFADRA